jgi:hypothetical protein
VILVVLIGAIFVFFALSEKGPARAFDQGNLGSEYIDPVDLPWTEPPDYQIVYIFDQNAEMENSQITPEALREVLGAKEAASWDDVQSFDSQRQLDALLIHGDALSEIDQDWIRSAYRQGGVIVFFNIYAHEVAQILDDEEIIKDGFADEPYPGEFFLIVSRLDSDRGIYRGGSQDQIRGFEDIERFALVLMTHFESMDDR